MPLNDPQYKVNDRVEFDITNQGQVLRTLTGTVQTVDPHGTYETCYADASYDVYADGLGWFKHIAECRLRPLGRTSGTVSLKESFLGRFSR